MKLFATDKLISFVLKMLIRIIEVLDSKLSSVNGYTKWEFQNCLPVCPQRYSVSKWKYYWQGLDLPHVTDEEDLQIRKAADKGWLSTLLTFLLVC